MRTLRRGAAIVLLLAACRPETPGRDCTSSADCFREEVCASGTCIARADEAPVGGAGAGGGTAGTVPDAALPDAVGADAVTADASATDANAPDASPVDGAAAVSDVAWDAAASDVGP